MIAVRTPVALAVFLLLAAARADALLDIPASERSSLAVTDLASGSGVARPADPALGPLDDRTYLDSWRALESRGLVDPLGERLQAWADTRSDGGIHWESLVPQLTVRPYYLEADGHSRTLHHSSGDTLEDGFNAFLSASGAAFWGEHVGGAYELQLQERPGDWAYRTKRLYLKGVWGKWSLKVGRDAERLGPGYHGSLLLDSNAPTMDLWRIRTEEPLFLPWGLDWLGGFRFTLFNAYLSDPDPDPADPRYGSGEAPVHDPRLLGMRFSYHPAHWLDLGVSRAILYGGKGREVYDTPTDWWELFSATNENVDPGESDRYDNDQYVAFDFTARLPFLSGLGPLKAGKVYWEHAATDIISTWQGEDTHGWMPFKLNKVANLGGLYLSTAVTELRLEFAQTEKSWYRHNEYPQGYTYRGIPLGHHMGGDARNWFIEVSRHFGPAWRATVGLDLEDRGRSLATPEERVEVSFSLEARRHAQWSQPHPARLDILAANVDSPLDEPAREDRTEVSAGVGITLAL